MSRIFRHGWATGKTAHKWYGEYRDLLGKRRKLALCSDKRASQQALDALDDAIKQASAGMTVSPQNLPVLVRRALLQALRTAGHRSAMLESSQKPLVAHLDDWHASLLAKGNTSKHADLVVKRARRVVQDCGFSAWSDFIASKVQTYLAGLRHGDGAISIQTSNFYLQAIQQFARWMVRDRRATDNPLSHLQGGNVKLDRRRDRRALSADEIHGLLDSVERGPDYLGISGRDRAMLYRLAVETGLRAGELRSLTPASFQLDADSPTVTVAAAYSKHRRQDIQPVRPAMADLLRPWLGGKPVAARVVRMPDKPAKMLKADLDAARDAWIKAAKSVADEKWRRESSFLKFKDSEGRVADFHALRHTFITNLTKGNVNPRVAQSLARHSTITLTMDRYSHVTTADAAAALQTLPTLPSRAEPAAQASESHRLTDTKKPQDPIDRNPQNWVRNWVRFWVRQRSPIEFPLSSADRTLNQAIPGRGHRNFSVCRAFDADRHRLTRDDMPVSKKPPPGFEPGTCGLRFRRQHARCSHVRRPTPPTLNAT